MLNNATTGGSQELPKKRELKGGLNGQIYLYYFPNSSVNATLGPGHNIGGGEGSKFAT